MKVKIFDTALNPAPGSCYFDVKKEIEHMQKKYVIKDIKTIMTYPGGFDVMLAIFYEDIQQSSLQQKEFDWTNSEEEINKFIASHDVLKVEHFNGMDAGDINTMVTYRKSKNEGAKS